MRSRVSPAPVSLAGSYYALQWPASVLMDSAGNAILGHPLPGSIGTKLADSVRGNTIVVPIFVLHTPLRHRHSSTCTLKLQVFFALSQVAFKYCFQFSGGKLVKSPGNCPYSVKSGAMGAARLRVAAAAAVAVAAALL